MQTANLFSFIGKMKSFNRISNKQFEIIIEDINDACNDVQEQPCSIDNYKEDDCINLTIFADKHYLLGIKGSDTKNRFTFLPDFRCVGVGEPKLKSQILKENDKKVEINNRQYRR